MIERLKTLLIILLSLSASLLLLINLGLDRDYILNEERGLPQRIFESTALFSDGFLPEEIIINFSQDQKTVIQNPRREEIWSQGEKILRQIFEEDGVGFISVDQISEELYMNLLNSRSLIMNFESNINLLSLLNSLGIKEAKTLVENFQDLEAIYISLDRTFIIVKTSQDYSLINFDQDLTGGLNQAVDRIYQSDYNPYQLSTNKYNTKNIFYYPLVSQARVQKVSFTNILEDLDKQYLENIIKSFFKKEINYLREIREEDMTIYVDGSKTLKITSKGQLEYQNPDLATSKERNLYISLKSALDFISENLGYDNTMYLKKINLIEDQENKGYNFIFGKQSHGIKVDLDYQGARDYIDMEVYNRDIRSYKQVFRKEKEQTTSYYDLDQTMDLENMIESRLVQIRGLTGRPELDLEGAMELIEEARVYYLDKLVEEELKLYWRIRLDSQDLLLPIGGVENGS